MLHNTVLGLLGQDLRTLVLSHHEGKGALTYLVCPGRSLSFPFSHFSLTCGLREPQEINT